MALICLAALPFIALCPPANAIPGTPLPGAEVQAQQRATLEYMQIFRKTWLASREVTSATDAAPYSQIALASAAAQRDKQTSLCKVQAPVLKTEAAYASCLTTAYFTFATAIGLKDRGATEGLAASLAAAAADADAGLLTQGQVHDVYDTLTSFYQSMFTTISALYDLRVEARLAATNRDLFEKNYREAGPVAVTVSQPPLDDLAEPSALEIAAKARAACAIQSEKAPRVAYVECVSAAQRQFALSVALRDSALNRALDATLRAVASGPDAEQLRTSQLIAVTDTLIATYLQKIDQQQADYHAVADRPVAEGYVVRFSASYILVAGTALDRDHAPYDREALEKAIREQVSVLSTCAIQRNEAASEVANLDCWFAEYRRFADAIKVRDKRLLEMFLSAMHNVAADTDAGRLTRWQERTAYDALIRAYTNAYFQAYNWYMAHQYPSLVMTYVAKFDNDTIAAGTKESDSIMPPWDIDAKVIAEREYDQSIKSCFDRKSEFNTHAAFWECRAAAERARAVAARFRDIPLFERSLNIAHQAAADADAGTITSDQLDAVIAGLSRAFNALLRQAWLDWRAGKGVNP